jgi:hypothetical protein
VLSLKKKKPEVIYQWHPNFRVVGTLPDIKVVRTDFVVISAAVTLAVMAMVWMLYVEVCIFQVDRTMRHLQAQIDENNKTNMLYLSQSSKFMHNSKGLQELTKFYAQAVPVMELMNAVLAARPDNILFDSVTLMPTEIVDKSKKHLKTQAVVLTGELTGEAEDLKALDGMVTQLMASPVLKPRISDPANDRKIENRRLGPGVFKFTITITLQPAP